MSDPYKTLNVPRDAEEAAIKQAYRRLAKKYHPDRNGGSKDAAERFSEISSAYEFLSDKDKRARYDRGEIDEKGQPKAPYGFSDFDGAGPFSRQYGFRSGNDGETSSFRFSGDTAEFADLFGDLFGAAGTGPGRRRSQFSQHPPEVRYRLKVSFEDAAALRPQTVKLESGNTIELKLPPGFENGTTLRVRDKKGVEHGGATDALIILEIEPHRFFCRDGDDVRLDLPVRWDEAVLGAKVTVPTPDGTVRLSIPKGSTSGQMLRIKGKGFHRHDGSRGNQIVRLMVHLPSGDPELEALAKSWSARSRENPRASLGV